MEGASERQEPAGLVDRTRWADGYVWADNPTAASYTPDPFYSFNRTGGAIQITKPAGTIGRYVVKFNGLSGFLGAKSALHVTAYSGDNGNDHRCKPVGAYLVNSVVEVRCFQASTGAAVNTFFTVLVTRKYTDLAFAYAHQPTATNYAPQGQGSWNPAGAIKVVRNGVGTYTVVFSGLGTLVSGTGNSGHVQVNAVGTGKARCKVRGWGRSTDLAVGVNCHTQAGTLADTKFNLLFLLPSEHLAYAWADKPSVSIYTPDTNYSSNPTGGGIVITRYATGTYTVSWDGIDPEIVQGGDVQVTAYGQDNAQCNVNSWGFASADVRCTSPNGAPVDRPFTVLLGS